MSGDFERRLRDDLAHRAAAVTPEPSDWDDLSRRMSRRDRRTRTWLTVGLVVALIAGPIAGFGIARAVQDDDTGNRVVAGAGPGGARVPGVPSESASSALAPGTPFGSAHLEPTFRRTTGDGVTIRAFTTPQGGTAPACGASGWCPPRECFPNAGIVGQLSTDEAIGYAYAGHYTDTPQRLRFTGSGVFGANGEGSPVRWVVAQTGSGVAKVRVSFEGGGSDQMAPVDGTVLLAARADTGKTGGAVEALDGSGSVVERANLPALLTTFAQAQSSVILLSPDMGAGPPQATTTTAAAAALTPPTAAQGVIPSACLPPPPALPAAGEQPADPAAARAAITEVFATAYNGSVPVEDKAAVAEDGAALADAGRQIANGPYAQQVKNESGVVTEIVFTSPTEAAVRYDIKIKDYANFDGRIGRAVLVDGRWKVSRATMCADISLAGVRCPAP